MARGVARIRALAVCGVLLAVAYAAAAGAQQGLDGGTTIEYDELRSAAADTAVDVEWDSDPTLVDTIFDDDRPEAEPVAEAMVDAGAGVSRAAVSAPPPPVTSPSPAQPAAPAARAPEARQAAQPLRSVENRDRHVAPPPLRFAAATGVACTGEDGGGASAQDCFRAGSAHTDTLVSVWARGRQRPAAEYEEAERLLRLAIALCKAPTAASAGGDDAAAAGDDFTYAGTAAQAYLMLGQLLLSSPQQHRHEEAQALLLASVRLATPPGHDVWTVTHESLAGKLPVGGQTTPRGAWAAPATRPPPPTIRLPHPPRPRS